MEEKLNTPADFMKQYCTQFNTFLDIGVGSGLVMYSFEDFGYKKFIGIDKVNQIKPFSNYVKYKKLDPVQSFEFRQQFAKKFLFSFNGYDKYIYEINEYSFILMRYFLHFIPDDAKYALIKRLYNLLEPGGIMYIILNHNENTNNTDPNLMDKIDENTYRSKSRSKTMRYLVNKEDFISNMKPYTKIEELCSCNENEITLVLTKPL